MEINYEFVKEQALMRALRSFLSDFPEDKSGEEILALIEGNSEEVVIWEPFENYYRDELVSIILDEANAHIDFVILVLAHEES